MILKGKCEECGTEIKLDIGDKTLEEATESLAKRETFECPGHHVELCSPYPAYWNIDTWERVDGSAPTKEEFLGTLKAKYKEVLTTSEMHGRNVITGFAMGFVMTNDNISWDFVNSPDGERFYCHN